MQDQPTANSRGTPRVPIAEAQPYQSIGRLAPDAEQALTHQHGWDGAATNPPTAVAPITQLESPNFSFWNKRANLQDLGSSHREGPQRSYAEDFFVPDDGLHSPTRAAVAPLAGYAPGQGAYDQTPTAATHPAPYQMPNQGILQGDDAARERSGNIGITDDANSH